MNYKWLGRTGVKVSSLCLGTMSFGGDADRAQSRAMYDACREAGINFFDCADTYCQGRSEQILGELMQSERDDLVITSKCFQPMGDDINCRGANRRHIARAVEASLNRLGTDRIDVLFMHRWDENTPIEETLRALEQLVSDGKVLYLGASNYAAWQVAKALGVCERHGWARIDVLQPMYSLVKRQVESEILPLARAEGLGVMTYSPLGGGLLSGKYGSQRRPESGRLISNKQYSARYGEPWVFDTAEAFTDLAHSEDVHPVSLAVAWVASNPDITCPIIGARHLEQLRPALDSVHIDMTSTLRARITELSRHPSPATDRLEERE